MDEVQGGCHAPFYGRHRGRAKRSFLRLSPDRHRQHAGSGWSLNRALRLL